MRLVILSSFLILTMPSVILFSGCWNKDSQPALTDVSDPGNPDAKSFTGSVGGGSAEAGTDASTTICNTLPETAAQIPIVKVASDPPAPQGGTVADGTYVLTKYELYVGADAGATGQSVAEILKIAGSTVDTASLALGAASWFHTTVTFTYPVAGQGMWVPTCPAGGATVQFSYTATATEFTLYADDTTLQTFTKQ